MLPDAPVPSPPQIAAPRSLMMSPKRFVVTMTLNCYGFCTSHIDAASTYIASCSTSG